MDKGNPVYSIQAFIDMHMPVEVTEDGPDSDWPIWVKVGDVNAMGGLNLWFTRGAAADLRDRLAELLRTYDQPATESHEHECEYPATCLRSGPHVIPNMP